MTRLEEVAFPVEGGLTLRGLLYVPHTPGPHPALSMAHGYGGVVRESRLLPFAERFAEAGFVVLLHDHRTFGASDGEPRQDIDPWQQITDWRRAVTYLESRPEVDATRIGLWGTSYAGGHALVLGATDRRLRAVVSQVPTISGFEQGLRRIPAEHSAALEEAFNEDERAQLRGEPPRRQALVGKDPTTPAAYRTPDAVDFYLEQTGKGGWENSVTVRSTRAARMYEPGAWAPRVSPTPLLMVVGNDDHLTPTDLALAAFERALEPKRLVLIDGGHFAPYSTQFPAASQAALDWFRKHLT
ncbi:alpha/beta hydrolase [Streptomyces sp. 3214.6]|uniref:alpha/beta hydrolase n=1 Tax=Streptomyces sp. 3214.6 TaxID=1882757 RepID=UPI00090BC61B|nr:alpha/beta fold hydrolase [Streptomyces sp. 3214.6]SHH30423.1 hypothetical protein SAMN05444521_0060 [Streptomyces sp. 3214.6]